ncbi:hypothetical protein HZH66_013404 [Vespula vulgaris]|uniref:Uncharacterized protein n=1 Tax=Vespula vulgaris TaxID=7454 RepID=A0A834J7G3_VESVU|nr:hypothetical protein HZH66_013404 [Vespula vulgaris]
MKWCGGDTLPLGKGYKTTDFGSGHNLVTSVHYLHPNTRSTQAPQLNLDILTSEEQHITRLYRVGPLGGAQGYSLCALSEDFGNLPPREHLEIFIGWHRRSFDFALSEDDGDISPRVDLEIFTGCHSSEVKCGSGDTLHHFDCVPSEDVDNLSPREDLEIFTDAIRVNINDQLIQIYNSLFDFRLKCELCFELRRVDLEIFTLARDFDNLSPRVDLEIFTDAIRVSINEQLIQIYNSLFDFRLKYEVGIHGCEREQQRRAVDRLLQLLIQLCFGLGRGNLEIFADTIRANLNAKWGYTASRDDNKVGSLTDLYNCWFSCALELDQ